MSPLSANKLPHWQKASDCVGDLIACQSKAQSDTGAGQIQQRGAFLRFERRMKWRCSREFCKLSGPFLEAVVQDPFKILSFGLQARPLVSETGKHPILATLPIWAMSPYITPVSI